ncbi:putative ribonuclease H-like domain-containing protein [Tanacetum coccineum]
MAKLMSDVMCPKPPGFIDPKYPKKVCKVVKALYGLHQAPKAYYATLSTFLPDYLCLLFVLSLGFRVSLFDLEAYSDSDYAGANLDRRSTTGGCQFLGRRLISWQCKKQTIVATSTIEAEYVAAANCCGQVL